ncbi:TetR/AcrR family transcriptional regulator [Vibrio sp. SCSIO 43136]|uniref:TetR/AcrR family transcriptional regulator n=1 Tax=Vibrio sp. SCSIO 43136 TaxID=2819101 RepID=UPI002075CF69|nr:TetR/AcrR family transcriptional regulator [Vibrio sp. SCSIO 43136]USD66913.1 TetR/AcrR family transcriptional regulator [Vibrio sp. SCSIO 43136]
MSKKKQQILDTALELFVAQGISETSTASIAKTAGVANGTLFHHFANKEMLCHALYAELKMALIEEILQDLPEDLAQKGQQLWLRALEWFVSHPAALKYLQRYYVWYENPEQDSMAMFRELNQFLYRYFEDCQKQGILATQPLDYLALMAQNTLFTTADFLIRYPLQDTPEFRASACQQSLGIAIAR